MPKDEAISRIANINFQQFTSSTLPNKQALLSELDEISATGNAYDREEHEPGIHCVAAPVFSDDRSIGGGISVTAPSYRISVEQLVSWAETVRETASAINADLPIRMGPRA